MSNILKLSTITTLNPLDGRYSSQMNEITPLFCDLNLTLTRITIEIEWLKTLAEEPKIKEIKPLTPQDIKFLHSIVADFTLEDSEHIKELENKTNHDIKAIEYFLREKLASHKKLADYQEFIHFGATSDDINNLSYGLILAKARNEILLPTIQEVISQLGELALTYAKAPMLAHTHGQPATPTTFGKEMANFAYRLTRQYEHLATTSILGKFNGTVGNFNAHHLAYPEINWEKLSQNFVENLGLEWNPYTTQIEPHDWLSEYCDNLARSNTILIGLCRDLWNYIAFGYLKQKFKNQEVGSSIMPHKINPIDFENAEGNLGIANALLHHFSTKLPISRWQRDLTDSTVMRNLGVAIGHTVLAYKSLLKGLNHITVDETALKHDLENHWEILTEAIQTVMRRFNIKDSYNQLKNLARGQKIDKNTLHDFINKLSIPHEAKQHLLKLTPEHYTGKAGELAKKAKEYLPKKQTDI